MVDYFDNNEIHIRAVCITLNQYNKERAQRAISEIQSLGFKNVEFFHGVDGGKLSEGDIKELLTPRSYYELKNGRFVHEGLSGVGSVGCYLSHTNIWKECLQNNEIIAIFEDDFVSFDSSKEELIKSLKEAFNHGFEVLRINHRRNPDYVQEYEDIPGYESIVKMKRTEGTTAYIMTPQGASKLLETYLPIDIQLDSYVDIASFYHDLNHISTKKDFFNDQSSPSINDHNSLQMYEDGLNMHTIRRNKSCFIVTLFLLVIIVLLLYYLFSKSPK